MVEIIASFLKKSVWRYRIHIDRYSSTVFLSLTDELEILVYKNPDKPVTDHLLKKFFLVEITICYDLHHKYTYNAKVERYKPLVDCLTRYGYDVEMLVLCFGSLGSVRNDA